MLMARAGVANVLLMCVCVCIAMSSDARREKEQLLKELEKTRKLAQVLLMCC